MLVEAQLRMTWHLMLAQPASSLPLGNDFSSLNLISTEHSQLFPRALKGW